MKNQAKKKTVTDVDLRDRGYMTSDEFVDKFVLGLKEYLQKNWGTHNKHELHHPEDLISNVSVYVEAAYHVIADFGVAAQKDKE
jgi:hypothetical protein